MGCYYHILVVVDNAVFLAERYGADIKVVTIAAWFHDIASVTDYSLYEEHHIHGARISEEILGSFGYGKTGLVKRCILNHHGSRPSAKPSVEDMSCRRGRGFAFRFGDVPVLSGVCKKGAWT